ncbi:PREDICTED: occludin/ELL domain-containing protein 1 isoform X2 [Nanorana parkeri]|uniref:occludin/ELL domain-containing protein 1 isoform X2 n=1 Tax=Nanorana parkeri TaxID=125878 RepID=UPI0008546364|nr:PREDICTED: occludin/ELL domain-containing protein 1 isoform X2 [Nanorana parkeri]
MSSFPSLTEKQKNRRPTVWPSETSTWGDAPSFSFDYYDHDARKQVGTLSDPHDTQYQELSGMKPAQHFIPESWKRYFWKSRKNGEPFPLKNLEGVHNSPPVTPLLDASTNSTLEKKSGILTASSNSVNPAHNVKNKKTPDSLERRSQMNYGEKRMDRPRRIIFQDEVQHLEDMKGKVTKTIHFTEKGSDSGALNRSIPAGHRPKPHMVPDYVLKYPDIQNPEEREKYKAVFNDQYAEYKELYSEVRTALLKFKELDSMMEKITSGPQSKKAPDRIKVISEKYKKKKNDPAFIEKRERCAYLKEKLSHIKKQIQAYDQCEGSVYF